MLHEPASQGGPDPAASYKMRLGVYMFIAYALLYAGFVVINTFASTLMEATVIFGLNLATAYGFGLIILALILALIYNRKCYAKEAALKGKVSDAAGEDR